MVRDRPPHRTRGACWPYAFRGPARLAAIQGPIQEGALPRPAGTLVPDSLDRYLYRLRPRYGNPLDSDLGIAAIVLVLLGFVLAIVPLAQGCYAAYKVNQGVEYRYPYIADRIEGPRGVV